MESGKAFRQGRLSEERKTEMDKLARADLVIFQFPMFWSSAPAILKGWWDKVLVDGFAFNFERGDILEKGLMKVCGKRQQAILTAKISVRYRQDMKDWNIYFVLCCLRDDHMFILTIEIKF